MADMILTRHLLDTKYAFWFRNKQNTEQAKLHTPLQKCSLTADDGASFPQGWCTHSAGMVRVSKGCGGTLFKVFPRIEGF